MECQKKSNLEKCPCTGNCEVRGICCECLRFHLDRKELPTCCFNSETRKTHDRSFKKFIEENSL